MSDQREPRSRYDDMLAAYRDGLQTPGPDVKRAVMAVLADRKRGATKRAWWRWFVRPQAMQMRPVLAAAGLALVIGLSAVVGGLMFDGSGAVPAPPPGTVLVRFELAAPQADRVALAGSFNNWNDSTILFSKSTETGRWAVTVPLSPGEHEYLFVVDGERWIPDPEAHAQVDDGFGQINSMIVVGPRGVVRS